MNYLNKLCIFLFLGLLLCSCGKKYEEPPFDPRLIHSPLYTSSLEKWSKEDKIYSGLSSIAFMNITHQSLEFRKAYVKELSRLKMFSLDEQKELLDASIKEEEEYITFIFRIYTAKKEWNDFHKGNSMWKITLKNDHNEIIDPHDIELLKSNDPLLAFFYPDINRWVNVYLIAFKKNDPPHFLDDTKTIELVIASFLARTSFTWTL